VEVDDLPTVTGERRELTQLLQNLVGNAIKFRGAQPPVIAIRARDEHDSWRISVIDNGVGIDPAREQRMFRMFSRLHESDDVPGAGVGLAICKRIAERHGGRMYATKNDGPGSTFTFSIAKQAPDGSARL